ncbi:MAG TPA: class I SAM-dependent methyltransferase [Ktedonobacteraceae bacterium]|jgi:SAM-dependent methyltransferase
MRVNEHKVYTGHVTLESMSNAKWYNNWTVNIFKSYLQGDILEVGCGIGSFTKMLVDYGNVYAIDLDEDCIEQTRQTINRKDNVGFGDIEHGYYFLGEKTFDTITCINVLEHIEYDEQALKNMYQLLKPAGVLVLLVPAHPFLYGQIDKEIGHYRRYTKKGVMMLLEDADFDVVYARKMNALGGIGWWFTGKILKDTSVSEKKLQFFDKIAPFILPLEEKIEPPIGTSVLAIAKKR